MFWKITFKEIQNFDDDPWQAGLVEYRDLVYSSTTIHLDIKPGSFTTRMTLHLPNVTNTFTGFEYYQSSKLRFIFMFVLL